VALVLSWLMRLQLGFPNSFSCDRHPAATFQYCHHALHDHVSHATVVCPGGIWHYLMPADGGALAYVNMVSYWVYLFAVLLLTASFFVTARAYGRGWTRTAAGDSQGPLRGELGNYPDARFPGSSSSLDFTMGV